MAARPPGQGARVTALEEIMGGMAREIDVQRASLARLAAHLESLPAAARTLRLGQQPDSGSRQVDILTGPAAQWDFWLDLLTRNPPRSPVAVFPDIGQLISMVVDNLGLERSAQLGIGGMRSRVITAAEHLTEPHVRESIARFASNGLDVRTVGMTPGWFYADEKVAVVPTDWSTPSGTSLVITRDVAVVAALRAYFDDLWDRAVSVSGGTAGWDSVLSLLAQGMSDGAIALTLGQSLRTVRRRIAEASEAFGAASRFALGVEWEKYRQG